jgi:hypothetical protein
MKGVAAVLTWLSMAKRSGFAAGSLENCNVRLPLAAT